MRRVLFVALFMSPGLGLGGCEGGKGEERSADAPAPREAAKAQADAERAEPSARTEAEDPEPPGDEQTARALAETEAKLAALEAERAALEAKRAKAKAEPRTPVEPELGPMSRPEPDFIALPAPPFAHTLEREAPVTQGPQPTLKKKSDVRNRITDTAAWLSDLGLGLPTMDVPVPAAGRPGSLPPEITAVYGGLAITTAIDDGPFTIAFHGSPGGNVHHAVVRTKGGDVVGALDFGTYTSTPGDDPSEAMFIEQELRWAQVRDGVLFACTNHRTYAASSGGLNAFITAIELSSGERLWQSAPLVCNAMDFLVRDGWIITGYGFTAEPDFLYVLDARTGEIASKTKIGSGPEFILEKDGQLHVRTYDRNLVFELR